MVILNRWRRFSLQLSPVDTWLIRLAIIASAIGAVATLLVASSPQQDYKPGDRFAALAGLNPSESPATVVFFLSSDCRACQRSSEILSRLAKRPRPFRVVVIGYEHQDLLRPFIKAVALDSDAVLTAPVGSIRFAQVPQVALLDQQGIVKAVWTGPKDIREMEAKILSAAQALGGFRVP